MKETINMSKNYKIDFTKKNKKNITEKEALQVYVKLCDKVKKSIKEYLGDNYERWILQTDHYPMGIDCPITIYFDGYNYWVYDTDCDLFEKFEENDIIFVNGKAKTYCEDVEYEYKKEKELEREEKCSFKVVKIYWVNPFDFCEYVKKRDINYLTESFRKLPEKNLDEYLEEWIVENAKYLIGDVIDLIENADSSTEYDSSQMLDCAFINFEIVKTTNVEEV